MVQVKGPGDRLHSFWFEEHGSVHGPITMATFVGAEARAAFHTATQSRATLAIILASFALFAVMTAVALLQAHLAFWSAGARTELFVTLILGWVLWMGWVVHCLRSAHHVRRKTVEIAPPRDRLARPSAA